MTIAIYNSPFDTIKSVVEAEYPDLDVGVCIRHLDDDDGSAVIYVPEDGEGPFILALRPDCDMDDVVAALTHYLAHVISGDWEHGKKFDEVFENLKEKTTAHAKDLQIVIEQKFDGGEGPLTDEQSKNDANPLLAELEALVAAHKSSDGLQGGAYLGGAGKAATGPQKPVVAKSLLPFAVELPQCEIIRQTGYAHDTPSTDRVCRHRASVVILGKQMCRKHAGTLVLDMILSGGYKLVQDFEGADPPVNFSTPDGPENDEVAE